MHIRAASIAAIIAASLLAPAEVRAESGAASSFTGRTEGSEKFSLSGEIDFQSGTGNIDSSTSVLFGAMFRL